MLSDYDIVYKVEYQNAMVDQAIRGIFNGVIQMNMNIRYALNTLGQCDLVLK